VFPLMATGWAAMSGAALNVIVAPWFERRRGLAISIAFNGAAVGGVLLVPALVFLIGRIGFRPAVLSLVALMVAVLTPLVLWLLARGPEAVGLAPDGDPPRPGPRSRRRPARSRRGGSSCAPGTSGRSRCRSPSG
jgi:MFS family permease